MNLVELNCQKILRVYKLNWIELDNASELNWIEPNFSRSLNWVGKLFEVQWIELNSTQDNFGNCSYKMNLYDKMKGFSYGYDLFCNYFPGLSYPVNESYQRLYVSISIILHSHDLIIVFLLFFLWCMRIVQVSRLPMYPCAFLFFKVMGTMLIYLFVYWPNIRHTFVLMDGYDILFRTHISFYVFIFCFTIFNAGINFFFRLLLLLYKYFKSSYHK